MAVDTALASLSDTVFSLSIVTYSVAVVGFAGEYAFGRQGRVARSSEASGDVAVLDSSRIEAQDQSRRRALSDRFGRLGLLLTAVGAALQILSLTMRGFAAGRVPWGNMFEFATGAGLVAVVAFGWLVWQTPRLRHLGVFVLMPVVFLLVYAGLVLYTEAGPLVAALRSYWLVIHVAAAILATGIFMVSFVLTLLYLVRHRYERGLVEDKPAPPAVAGVGRRLPEAELLDRLAYRTVAFAFPIWTFAVIAGAIWAESAWGRFWGWDPKETWALIAWIIYAGYLHARATAGWKGTKAAYVNLVGFFAMTFNFLMVNLVVSGLHSYSGLT
ncbi:MAG: c-type cytochrome biogenesis protein CcsB [Geodermatophilaceae bacterium]|nr:c-type cytochrome biogenesis protein CcsB [Geodermatophilaceae bacterium]